MFADLNAPIMGQRP